MKRDGSHARRRDRDVCGREAAGNTANSTTVPDDRESKKRVHQEIVQFEHVATEQARLRSRNAGSADDTFHVAGGGQRQNLSGK